MGVGGGFIMVPMMVYLLRIPPHVAVGTGLFQVLFTFAGVTYLQATTNHTVDLVLAVLLAAGSTIGAQIGARVSRFLRGDQLLIILASLALLVAGQMVASIVKTPSSLLSPAAHASLYQEQRAPAAPARCCRRLSASQTGVGGELDAGPGLVCIPILLVAPATLFPLPGRRS